jgi:hypothetical protein
MKLLLKIVPSFSEGPICNTFDDAEFLCSPSDVITRIAAPCARVLTFSAEFCGCRGGKLESGNIFAKLFPDRKIHSPFTDCILSRQILRVKSFAAFVM